METDYRQTHGRTDVGECLEGPAHEGRAARPWRWPRTAKDSSPRSAMTSGTARSHAHPWVFSGNDQPRKMAGPVGKRRRYLEYAQINPFPAGVHVPCPLVERPAGSFPSWMRARLETAVWSRWRFSKSSSIACGPWSAAQANREHIGISVHVFDGCGPACAATGKPPLRPDVVETYCPTL